MLHFQNCGEEYVKYCKCIQSVIHAGGWVLDISLHLEQKWLEHLPSWGLEEFFCLI